MERYLKEKTVPVLLNQKVEVILRNDSGTLEVIPSLYSLSTLNFSFWWDDVNLILYFQPLLGMVPIPVWSSVTWRYIETYKVESGIIFKVDAIRGGVSVLLRNLKNFDYISYFIVIEEDQLNITTGKGTSQKNFWKNSFVSSLTNFTTSFSPEESKPFYYVVPSDYGLKTINLGVNLNNLTKQIVVEFDGTEVTVDLVDNNGNLVARREGFLTNDPMIEWNAEGTRTDFTVQKIGNSHYIVYSVSIVSFGEKHDINVTWRTETGRQNQIPVFSLQKGILPRVEGYASLTYDKNMICELEYKIIKINNIKNYKIYNLNFLDQVRYRKEETIPEVVRYLSQFQKVEQTAFIGYSITRLILSHELFGEWKEKYLRQCYYPRFLSLLSNSDWKDFLPFFTSPEYGVTNYHLLFH